MTRPLTPEQEQMVESARKRINLIVESYEPDGQYGDDDVADILRDLVQRVVEQTGTMAANAVMAGCMDTIRAKEQRIALLEGLLREAVDEMECPHSGDSLKSHWCVRCDDFVDRNRPLRDRIDAATTEAAMPSDEVTVATAGTFDRRARCVVCWTPMVYRVDKDEKVIASFCGRYGCLEFLREVADAE
jgi:hypothetical protein